MTLRYGSATNGFIPEWAGQIIAFVRQPDKFKINKYIQLVPSDEPIGVYSILSRDESVRVVTSEEFVWMDGADMPSGDAYGSRFDTDTFTCQRYAFPWNVGNVTEQTARVWKPRLTHMVEATSKCMTHRTWKIVTTMTTSTNWPSSQTADANTINGGHGRFDLGSDDPNSGNYLAFKRGLLGMAQQINLYTNSVVTIDMLRFIMSPKDARKIGQSPEMTNYLRESPFAKEEMSNPGGAVNELWGLPKTYAGIELVVEDATRVSERPTVAATTTTEATSNRDYIFPAGSGVMMSQVGGLDGELGGKNFSTMQMYYWRDLLRVKAEYDQWNEKIKGAVVDYFTPKLAAPYSGFLCTNITA